MITLRKTDNASQFIDAINANLLSANINMHLTNQMNAMQIIDVLNNIFKDIVNATILTLSMNSCEFIDAVNKNFEQLMPQGASTIKFLHISDIHNLPNADAIVECKNIMDNDTTINFTILTGDYTGYNGSYSNMTPALKEINDKLLMLNGNHDVYDGFKNDQANATAYLKEILKNSDVEWGDSKNIASYYYKDYNINGNSKLRIISLDSYDYQKGIGSKYDTAYSQEQVDWIISKITELRSTDFFIVAMHEPPVNATIEKPSYNVEGKMDKDIVSLRRTNDFCSSRLWTWDTSYSNGNLLPIIVNAYLNKENIVQTVINENSLTKEAFSTVDINYDFSTIGEPATFLFYIGGHLHGDLAAYHPDYPQQLILLVDCASNSTLGQSSDIGDRSTTTSTGTRSDGILINEVDLDFQNKQITVTRRGQNKASSNNGFPEIVREKIKFPFVR